MDIDSCYKVGYVTSTHGLNGEVTVVLTEAVSLANTKSFFLQIRGNLVPYFLEYFSDRGDKAFIKFEDVTGPEEAKGLKGASLFLPRRSRKVPERGEFYDDEVIGFSVEDETEGPLGKVVRVESLGPNRMLAIDRAGKEVLIPVQGPFIKSLNRTKKRFIVDLPSGFLDI